MWGAGSGGGVASEERCRYAEGASEEGSDWCGERVVGGEWLVCSSNKSPQLWWGERYGPTHHFSASNSDFYLPKWPFSLLAGTVNVSALITMRGYCRPVRLLADFFPNLRDY